MLDKKIDLFFTQKRDLLKKKLETEPIWSSFRDLSDTLLSFLWAETQMLMMTPSTRSTTDATGYTQHLEGPEDPYHPKKLTPLYLKGYWISENEGQLLQIDENIFCPLIRKTSEGKEILFLIHPKSEPLFHSLIQQYEKQEIYIPALALSSFRTHLIALPTPNGKYIYTMVKLSLDAHISGTSRIVSPKECGHSVGMSALLQQKRKANMAFFLDDMAFFSKATPTAGIIHRPLPTQLLNGQYTIPFFSLLGHNNKELFDLLVKESKVSPLKFINTYLLKPLAKHFINLIYHNYISIEAHPQNLLLVIHTTNGLHIDFIYRDMGGVNALASNKEISLLPKSLENECHYYFDTHDIDTARALEFFAVTTLFNLTKQQFKSNTCLDPTIHAWKLKMIKKGHDCNWHIENENPDAHDPHPTPKQFFRYGYIERKFSHFFLEEMKNQNIFKALAEENESIAYQYFKTKFSSSQTEWFHNLILETYPAYRQKQSEYFAIQSVQSLLEKTLTNCKNLQRPFSTPSKDLFQAPINRLKNLFELGYISNAVHHNPYLSGMDLQIQNQIKHLDLECEVVHPEYPHEPSFNGPYPFGPTLKTLQSAFDFLYILNQKDAAPVKEENCNFIKQNEKSSFLEEEVLQSKIAQLREQESSFIKQVIENAPNIYNEFRYRLESEGFNASFPEFSCLIQVLQLSLKTKHICEAIHQNQALAHLRKILSTQLTQIQESNYPYRTMLDGIESALCFFDLYARGKTRNEAPPPLFHSALYQYYSAYLKEEVPCHILFPTLYNLGATDLLKVRGIPLGFLGVHVDEIWVDGFLQTPFEFWSHDINHTRRMWQFFKAEATKQQLTPLQFSQKSHYYLTKQLIPLIQINKEDPYEIINQKRMVKIILFEILHEEALPADPKVLAQALMAPPESPTAIEIMRDRHIQYTMERSIGKLSFIHKKLTTNFYDLIEERKEFIVAHDCRSKHHVFNAAIWMARKLQLPDINEPLLWEYLQKPPDFSDCNAALEKF